MEKDRFIEIITTMEVRGEITTNGDDIRATAAPADGDETEGAKDDRD